MKKALIVDDEEWIRLGLREQVDWIDLGIEISGEAWNGLSAIEIIEKKVPQILITDIRMPVMGGIELIEYIKKNNLNIKIIVISGYSEFEYAKKAISFNVSDYLLKPIEEKELEDALLKVVKKIDKEKMQEKNLNTLKMKISENVCKEQEKALTDFILELVSGPLLTDVKTQLSTLTPFEQIFAIVLKTYSEKGIVDMYGDESFLTRLFLSAFEHVAGVEKIIFRNYKVKDEVIIIVKILEKINQHEILNIVFKNLKIITEQIRVQHYYKVYVGIGKTFSNYKDIKKSYNQAYLAVINSGIVNTGNIVHVTEIEKRDEVYSIHYDTIMNILFYIDNDYRSEAIKEIEYIFEEIKANILFSPTSIRNMILNLTININKLLQNYKSSIEELTKKINITNVIINKRFTIADLEQFMTRIIDLTVDYIGKSKKSGIRESIINAVDHINSNYKEDINLQELSDRYFVDISYFSRMFKIETGTNFTKYLSNVRMEKASKLLQNKSLKMYDIAKLTGYRSSNYFYKIFKKYFGCTPSEYRLKIHRNT